MTTIENSIRYGDVLTAKEMLESKYNTMPFVVAYLNSNQAKIYLKDAKIKDYNDTHIINFIRYPMMFRYDGGILLQDAMPKLVNDCFVYSKEFMHHNPSFIKHYIVMPDGEYTENMWRLLNSEMYDTSRQILHGIYQEFKYQFR